MCSQMVQRFLSQELLNITWIYSPEELTKYAGSSCLGLHRHLHIQNWHSALCILAQRCTLSLILLHTLIISWHTCCCLSTKAVLYGESTDSERKHKPYGRNGRREVLKQINNTTCLMNFPIFPGGKDEVKGTSAHLPWSSWQLQFVSNFNGEK